MRTTEGRAPEDAHNKAALDLSTSLDPCPAYWAWLEKHFFGLLENLPYDWDTASNDWKLDDQQAATNTWRKHVKDEARESAGGEYTLPWDDCPGHPGGGAR